MAVSTSSPKIVLEATAKERIQYLLLHTIRDTVGPQTRLTSMSFDFSVRANLLSLSATRPAREQQQVRTTACRPHICARPAAEQELAESSN